MNRDAELVKIQVFADCCQALFTFFCSILVGSIIGLIAVLIATSYVSQIDIAYAFAFLFVIVVVGYIGIKFIMKAYNDDLDLIENLLNQVEKGESLPSLKELRKMR